MLNLFTKTTPWMVATLLAASVAISAQDKDSTRSRSQKGSYEQGHEIQRGQLMAGYNAPAGYDVRGSWDVFASGSFLYWQGREDNLELGVISSGSPVGVPATPVQGPYVPFNPTAGTFTTTSVSARVANPNFSYGPGFKVALGVNLEYDNWDFVAEYTWFHKTSRSSADISNRCNLPVTSWLFPNRVMPVGLTGRNDSEHAYTSASQKWRLKLDFLDLSLGRSYYNGTRLTFRPFFGARGAWIRQKLKTTYNEQITVADVATVAIVGSNPLFSQTQTGRTISWGLGPRLGFESNWMVGCGFRLVGNANADVLYTRYNVTSRATLTSEAFSTGELPTLITGSSSANLRQKHIDLLRPHVDVEMGLGWGSYFDNNNWHVDLSATYGYQVFWDQNMFRFFTDSWNRSFDPNGNLYVHGLTFTARFDF